MTKDAPIMLPEMCSTHRSILVHDSGFAKHEAWQALLMVSNIVLFQVATCGERLHRKIGDDIREVEKVGCLACLQPDVFGEVVEAAKSKNILNIKAIADLAILKTQGEKINE